MDIEEVIREYIDRCERVLEEKEKLTDEHQPAGSDTNQQQFLSYARSVNSMEQELLKDFLDDVSYPNLKLLLAIFSCGEEEYDFPDDISNLKRSNVKKKKLINTLISKDPQTVIDHLQDALDRAEEEGIDLNR